MFFFYTSLYNLNSCWNSCTCAKGIKLNFINLFSSWKILTHRRQCKLKCFFLRNWNIFHLCVASVRSSIVNRHCFYIAKIFAIARILCRTICVRDFGRFVPICHVKTRIFYSFYKSRACGRECVSRVRQT